MRILVVSHEFPPIGGGGANACYFLTKEYVKAGHKVTVITANYKGMPKKELVNGVIIIRVNAKRKYKDYCNFSEMADYLMKAAKEVDTLQKVEAFDVCQIFFGIPSGPIGYKLKKKYRIPYIIRFGGGDIPGFQKRFKWVYKLIAPFVKVLWRNADALVANSNELKKFAETFWDKKHISVIHNGVDTDTFRPVEERTGQAEIKILFVSRLIERKGLQHIIPLLKNIQQSAVLPVKLVVVGDGPYKRELKELVKQHCVEESVQFAGGKEKDELIKYYQDSDIFILPSRMEGMPNVVLEAMACGLPIVMTPCGGAEELVCDNGYVVTIDQFEDAVVRLCNDVRLRLTMGMASVAIAREKFSWEQKAKLYLDIFGGMNYRV